MDLNQVQWPFRTKVDFRATGRTDAVCAIHNYNIRGLSIRANGKYSWYSDSMLTWYVLGVSAVQVALGCAMEVIFCLFIIYFELFTSRAYSKMPLCTQRRRRRLILCYSVMYISIEVKKKGMSYFFLRPSPSTLPPYPRSRNAGPVPPWCV
jgi:hypothetical protein